MLQTSDSDIIEVMRANKTSVAFNEPTFREVNELLNEITNLAWGGIKSRFFTEQQDKLSDNMKMQVPILINHAQKFISFGSGEPQLTFQYTIKSRLNEFKPITIFQKTIFNLLWSPEKIKLAEQTISEYVESGELELF